MIINIIVLLLTVLSIPHLEINVFFFLSAYFRLTPHIFTSVGVGRATACVSGFLRRKQIYMNTWSVTIVSIIVFVRLKFIIVSNGPIR